MTPRALPVLLALLLLLPAATAAHQVATLQASRLEASGADTTGHLAALETIGGSGTFLLSAARVEATLEQERSHTYLNETMPAEPPEPVPRIPLVRWGGYEDEGPRNASYADVQDGYGGLRGGHEVHVFPLAGQPLPEASPATACAALAPSARPQVLHDPEKENRMHAPGPVDRHKEWADTSRALGWDVSKCPAATWVVEGSFLLTLWEGDLAFHHANGTASYTTGAQYPDPSQVEGDRTNRMLYLAVHGGRLELQAAGAEVYLADARVEAPTLVVREARGTIAAAGLPLDGQDVRMQGALDAHVRRSGAGLTVQVSGELDSVGGQSVVAAAGPGLGPRYWIAALLILPVAAGGGAAAWRRRPARALARLGQLSLAGRHDAVASGARRLQRVGDLSGEATALRMEALARSGQVGAALDQARRLPPMEAALAQAYVYALAGDVPSCVASLRACAALDPLWLQAALQDPAFAAARRHPSLRAWAGPKGAPA